MSLPSNAPAILVLVFLAFVAAFAVANWARKSS
jgi:hypothetical protein